MAGYHSLLARWIGGAGLPPAMPAGPTPDPFRATSSRVGPDPLRATTSRSGPDPFRATSVLKGTG